jgi:hypothetical protein
MLRLRAAFAEHEHQTANDDCHQCERARKRPRERRGKVVRRAFPRRLREDGGRQRENDYD